jgi:bifunctional non-homologous end joining protein LigD
MFPIIPTIRREPFDDPEWTFELKFDGFRGMADTVNGCMLSKRGNRMRRFDGLLAALPAGCIFDGEIIAPDRAGCPIFADLMQRRGTRPTWPSTCWLPRARIYARCLWLIEKRS